MRGIDGGAEINERLIETLPTRNKSTVTFSTGKIASELAMPPMTLKGIVTKVGVMKKTATVTVSRWVIQKQTGKACTASRSTCIVF
jgi:hypothetical protein